MRPAFLVGLQCSASRQPHSRDAEASATETGPADLALRGGAIYTVDGARSWAQTIAIDDGRIVFVGTDAGAQDFIGAETQVVDLKGRMVVPGFQDVAHPPDLGGHRGELPAT